MQQLAFKMLFRKKGTAPAILAIALLIALITSVNCLVNNINSETTALTQLASIGDTYLVTSQTSAGLSDSQLNPNILNQIKNDTNVKYATAQQLIHATLTTNTKNLTITVTGVDDVQAYLKKNQASINGSISKTANEADVGVILANLACINKNDQVTLIIEGKSTQLKIVGITQARQQSDTQLIVPLTTLQQLTQTDTTISYIEFSIKNPAQANKVLSNLTQTLPSSTKITSTQQLVPFASDINNQTVNFINVWSIAIYAVVVAASYVTATRLINEAESDLYTMRTLGAKKTLTFNLILTYVLIIALIGSILGLSIGVVGTQLASTAVRWVWGNTQLAPFLVLNQTFEILILAVAASILGAIYPAVKGTQIMARENPQ